MGEVGAFTWYAFYLIQHKPMTNKEWLLGIHAGVSAGFLATLLVAAYQSGI
jgi:hypothetical protein